MMMKALIAMTCVCAATLLGASVAEAHRGHFHHAHHHHMHRAFMRHHFWHHHARHHHFGHWHHASRSVLQRDETAQELAPAGTASSSGLASWYHGRTGGFTAAHRSWPFGTRVLVTNRTNGRSVVVRINDRGPFIRGRVIDLNRASAAAIGVNGVSPVVLQRL